MAVQSEIQSLQERMQRCAAACQDEAKDSVPAGTDPNDAKFVKAQQGMDRCITACADKVWAPHVIMINLPPPHLVSSMCACVYFCVLALIYPSFPFLFNIQYIMLATCSW